MKLLKIYQISLIASCLLYLGYWFAPWLYGYLDSESQGILSYGGIKASFYLPDWFWDLFLVLNLIAYLGMFLFRKVFRTLYVTLIVLSYPLASLSGMVVMTGVEGVIISIVALLDGVVITLAYLTELRNKFY